MDLRTPGQIAYEAYGADRGWKTANGGDMPRWLEQRAELCAAWQAAAEAVLAALTSPALVEVLAERARQDEQWGGPRHDDVHTPDEFMAFVYKQRNRLDAELRDSAPSFRQRFVKICALALAAMESIDRNALGASPMPEGPQG